MRALLILALSGVTVLAAPPSAPVITEPDVDGKIVSAADVHMQVGGYSDPDGQAHFCTDWEIITAATTTTVWRGDCLTNLESVHVHLGDGVYVGVTALAADTDYLLRARFHDAAGEIGPYATRLFHTGPASQIFPLQLEDVKSAPSPHWNASGATLRVESGTGELLLTIGTSTTNPPPLSAHVPVRVVVQAGSGGVVLSESKLQFQDEDGVAHTIYLPVVALGANGTAYYWVALNGSTYVGSAGQTVPDFQTVARSAPVPWVVTEPGYQVEIFATGFQLPVNIAFVPNPGTATNSVWCYVAELYGNIKVVYRDGSVQDYATGLLNFNPTGNFPGSGEQGLAGLVVEPVSGDLIAGLLYDAGGGAHYPKVIRLHSTDGGRTAATQTTILDMVGESQGQSHQISNISFGPDGKLYVHMGDGFDFTKSLNLDSFRGKVLRLNLDGSAPADNPFYNAGDGITARDYIFAYGLRNPFGGTWRAANSMHFSVENGPSVDRLSAIVAGQSYHYDGTDASMQQDAIYNWSPSTAPVNCTFIQPATFAGSGFPSDKFDHLFVTESGPTYAAGTQTKGKLISEFVLDATTNRVSGPQPFVFYNGGGFATTCGLAAGPDGLYFTDLYKDTGVSPIERGANLLRIRYVGLADFVASSQCGTAPLTVDFADTSTTMPVTWLWDFGDGHTSILPNPRHTYTTNGTYDVRLTVTGAAGAATISHAGFITVGDAVGLRGAYFSGINFNTSLLSRFDPTVNFDWTGSAPATGVPTNNYSVRWMGDVVPQYSETYTFYTQSDDGVRLWVNNQLLITNFTNHGLAEDSATLTVTAGQPLPIQLDYFNGTGTAIIRLLWSSPNTPKAVIPADRLLAPCGSVNVGGDTTWETKLRGATTGSAYLTFRDDGNWTGYGVVNSGVVTLSGTWSETNGVLTGTVAGDWGAGTLTGTIKSGKKLKLTFSFGAESVRISGKLPLDYPALARFAWLPGSWLALPDHFDVSDRDPGLFIMTLADQTEIPVLAVGKKNLVAPGAKGKVNETKQTLGLGNPYKVNGTKF